MYIEEQEACPSPFHYSVDHENQTSQNRQNGLANRKTQGSIFCPKHSTDKLLHVGALASHGAR